jgi:hypothetical protein
MLQTFPNTNVLGPNIQFMAAHGVRGVFEETGGAAGDGTDMEELKDYVRHVTTLHLRTALHRTYSCCCCCCCC